MRTVHEALREEGEFGLAGWTGQSFGMVAAHRHRDLEINYVLAGQMTYLVGGRIVTLPPHRLCLLWGGVPHQMIRSPQAAEAIWVTIPLTTVLRWGLPESLIHPLLGTGFLEDAAPRPGDLDLLHQWLEDLPGRARAVHPTTKGQDLLDTAGRIVLLEIEARLRRFAQGLTASSRVASSSEGIRPADSLVAVEKMAQFIYRNFSQESIGVAEIAGAAHLHPNYAMTLFRQHTGMTLSQYLVLQRVAHAQRLLVTTGESIDRIARDSGFGSISRFYEAFRQHTGNSPRRFRLQREKVQ